MSKALPPPKTKNRSPRTSVQEAAAAADAHRCGGEKGSRHDVVLVVEDMVISRKLLQRHFQKLGCEVLLAKNGEEALEVFKANVGRIDCVFMDVEMPVMNGNEAAVAIRLFEKGLKGHIEVPVLRLSTEQSAAAILLSQKRGMTKTSEQLQKPYNFPQLTRALETYSVYKKKMTRNALVLLSKVAMDVKQSTTLRRPSSYGDLRKFRHSSVKGSSSQDSLPQDKSP